MDTVLLEFSQIQSKIPFILEVETFGLTVTRKTKYVRVLYHIREAS